jgi:hypothetical protein
LKAYDGKEMMEKKAWERKLGKKVEEKKLGHPLSF